jgi:hypothetical protein
MVDFFSILQSGYAASAPQALFSVGSRFANVDPKQWQGTWTGTDVNQKSFTVSIARVQGFRANVRLDSSAGLRQLRVFITTKNSFRIGDSSFTLLPDGKAKLVTIVTDPTTGKQTADTAFATRTT